MEKYLDEIQLKRSLICAELCQESYGLVARHDEVRTMCVKLLNTKEECFTSFLAEFQDTQAMVLNTEDEIY